MCRPLLPKPGRAELERSVFQSFAGSPDQLLLARASSSREIHFAENPPFLFLAGNRSLGHFLGS
jgi:hypothetical protein